MDVGHVGQNLYLACAAIGAGTCKLSSPLIHSRPIGTPRTPGPIFKGY